jgi:hypothetical protein
LLCQRPAARLLSVALHVSDLLVQLEVVGLQRLDLGTEAGDDLELVAKFLVRGRGHESIERTISEQLTASNSALRCRNLSLWLVTMGNIDVSTEGAKGTGVVLTELSYFAGSAESGRTVAHVHSPRISSQCRGWPTNLSRNQRA